MVFNKSFSYSSKMQSNRFSLKFNKRVPSISKGLSSQVSLMTDDLSRNSSIVRFKPQKRPQFNMQNAIFAVIDRAKQDSDPTFGNSTKDESPFLNQIQQRKNTLQKFGKASFYGGRNTIRTPASNLMRR